MSRARLLIVEDEAIIAADLADRLRSLGYDVVDVLSRGEDVVAVATATGPSLVLMDIRLAGAMDGVAAAEALHATCDVPVVYLTAHSDRATLQRAKLTEPFGYILKPFDERELEAHIEMALYKHGAERKLRQTLVDLEHERARLEERVAERTATLSETNAALQREVREHEKTHAALADSEARYRHLFATSPGPVLLHDGERILEANPATAALLGVERVEALAERPLAAWFHPDDREWLARLMAAEPIEGRAPHARAVRLVRDDGREVHAEALTGVCEVHGRQAIQLVLRDRSEHQQIEETLRRMNRALRLRGDCRDAVMHAGDERRLLESVCRSLVDVGGFRLAWAGLADYGPERLVVPLAKAGYDGGYLDAARISWAEGEADKALCASAVRGGRPELSLDARTDPRLASWREALGDALLAALALPLTIERRVEGVLVVHASDAGVLDGAEVRFLADLAEDLAAGLGLVRARAFQSSAEANLRESLARWRRLVDATPDPFFSLDLVGRHTAANRALCERLGLGLDQVLGRDHAELGYPPELARAWREAQERVVTSGKPLTFDLPPCDRDGSEHARQVTLQPIRDLSDRLVGLRGTVREAPPAS